MVMTKFQTQIRVLHTDNGGEYMSTTIQQFLKSQGSVHQTTCVGTPQQNGVAERKNRHLLEVVRASPHAIILLGRSTGIRSILDQSNTFKLPWIPDSFPSSE